MVEWAFISQDFALSIGARTFNIVIGEKGVRGWPSFEMGVYFTDTGRGKIPPESEKTPAKQAQERQTLQQRLPLSGSA